jgi:oligopeptide/dipeptide ABC transporter ATP-binding protein
MNPKEGDFLLEIEGLKTYFFTDEGVARAVDDVSLRLRKGETIGVVGESGCGKSVTALSIIGLIPHPPGKIVSGKINFSFHGDLTKLSEQEMRKIRGNEISMIFQEPMTALNPVLRIGRQIAEVVRVHQSVSKNESLERAIEMLRKVDMPAPEKRVKDYPHQLSGGMRQRVMIAMALACNPKLMLADEPTTALDVTIQAQILELMNNLKREKNTAIILITHDLGVIAEMAENVCVMYAGVIVETADVRTLFSNPLHPYTRALMASIPCVGKRERLKMIPGLVPSLLDLHQGCRFSDRCQQVHDPCRKSEPPLTAPNGTSQSGHQVRCWLYT